MTPQQYFEHLDPFADAVPCWQEPLWNPRGATAEALWRWSNASGVPYGTAAYIMAQAGFEPFSGFPLQPITRQTADKLAAVRTRHFNELTERRA